MKFTSVFIVSTTLLSASPSFAAPTAKENRSLESVGEAPVLSREIISTTYGRELTDVELQEREPFLSILTAAVRVGITAARAGSSAARVASSAARVGSSAARDAPKIASKAARKVVKDTVKDKVKNQDQQNNNQQNNNNEKKKEKKKKHHTHHKKHHHKRSLDVRDEYADFLEERDLEELLNARDFFDEEVYEERHFDDLD